MYLVFTIHLKQANTLGTVSSIRCAQKTPVIHDFPPLPEVWSCDIAFNSYSIHINSKYIFTVHNVDRFHTDVSVLKHQIIHDRGETQIHFIFQDTDPYGAMGAQSSILMPLTTLLRRFIDIVTG